MAAPSGEATRTIGGKEYVYLLEVYNIAGSTDLDGSPRLVSLRGKPFAPDARPDIGCYECQIQTPYCTLFMVQ